MATWANVQNGTAIEVVTMSPRVIFTPQVAALFSPVPDGTLQGATFSAGTWANPTPTTPYTAPIVYPVMTPIAFYLAFTPQERIAIKTSTDPIVIEFYATYKIAQTSAPPAWIDPNLDSIVEGLNYFAAPVSPGPGAGILASTARIPQIQAGIPQ